MASNQTDDNCINCQHRHEKSTFQNCVDCNKPRKKDESHFPGWEAIKPEAAHVDA